MSLGKTIIDWILSLTISITIVFWYFELSFLYPLRGRKHKCLHAKSKLKWKKVLVLIESKWKCQLWWGYKHPFYPSLPVWDTSFPSFDRKWTDLVRQRRTSKCFFPRRHFVYKQNNVYSISGKIKLFLSWENEKTYKITVANIEN